MKTWKVHEAKAKFSALLKAGSKAPQLIMNRKKTVGVLISYEQFIAYQEIEKLSERPSIAELLERLRALEVPEKDFPEIARTDRKNCFTR